MGRVCQLLIADFEGRFDWNDFYTIYERNQLPYDKYNLHQAIAYAEGIKEYFGLTVEPFYGFELEKFISWCKKQLEVIPR